MKPIEEIKILVVGDIMLDKYVVGEVGRISPEAPVPIVNVTEEYHTLGGCGNVVRNIAELGANVHCLASIGIDTHGILIEEELKKIGAKSLLITASKTTTVKERIIADYRKIQMLRVDREYTKSIKSDIVIEQFKNKCKNDYDMVVISDYAKGMISYELMQFLKQEQDAKIIVDPKPINSSMYNGVFMITPNDKEWIEMLFASAYNLQDVKFILTTKGKEGMLLIDNIKEESWKIDAEPVPVYNVSGAGDVVVAMMAVCLSHELNVLDSAYIANKCAGYAVTQPQTCVVPKDKFKKIYVDYFQGNV
jgi:rfaE bifunctional protein kinase chain/domain